MQDIPETFYAYDSQLNEELNTLRQRVNVFRNVKQTLSGESLERLRDYFRLKNIYTLSMGYKRTIAA
jgi:hypothetical protein